MQMTVRSALVVAASLLAACDPGRAPDGTDTPTTPTTPTPSGPEALCAVDVTCYGGVLDEPKAPCGIVITDADGTVLYDDGAGMELRGRSSMWFPKPQYAVELRSYSQLEVWPDATWRYLDGGAAPVGAWREATYDDSGWSTGSAPIGYGADYLGTTVDPSVTTYLRATFDVDSLDAQDVELGLKRTDGVAVWLNGVEVLRDRLAVGAAADDWATGAVPDEEADDWLQVAVDPSLLVFGTNALALEVHQAQAASDDLRVNVYVETSTEREADLFGMGAEADWILNGQYVDRALYRNRLGYDLFQSFGGEDRYATETRFCELVLDGAYQGVYTLGEAIERGDDRLDLNNNGDPGEAFIVKLDDEDGFHANAVGYGTWQLVYPKDPDDAELAAVNEALAAWEAAVTGPDPADPDEGIFAHLDLDSTVDFVLLQELMKNLDAYQLSVHLWKEPGGKLHFTPWDLDLTLGYPVDDCGHEGWNPRVSWTDAGPVQTLWIQEVAAVPAFRSALAARWQELRAGPLADDAILDRIEGYQATLAPAIGPNFAQWPIEDITFTAGGDEDKLCPVGSYEEEHQRVLDFLAGRLAWMDANLSAF